MILDSSTNSRV